MAIEMHFLPDVYVTCEHARGGATTARRSRSSIAAVNCRRARPHRRQALPLMENFPSIANKLRTLQRVGLGYIELARPPRP